MREHNIISFLHGESIVEIRRTVFSCNLVVIIIIMVCGDR